MTHFKPKFAICLRRSRGFYSIKCLYLLRIQVRLFFSILCGSTCIYWAVICRYTSGHCPAQNPINKTGKSLRYSFPDQPHTFFPSSRQLNELLFSTCTERENDTETFYDLHAETFHDYRKNKQRKKHTVYRRLRKLKQWHCCRWQR